MNTIEPLFQTERLTIRTCCVEDAARLTNLMTPQISGWVAAWPTPLSLEDTKMIIAGSLEATGAFPTVILEKATGRLVGWLKIEFSDGSQTIAELGYWIGENYQRRGYAFEVSQGALGFAFSKLGVGAVRAGAQVANQASLRLLAKLGMFREGREDVWAPARQRYEKCEFWRLEKPQ